MPYEPKNRLKEPLPVLQIRITSNDAVYFLNPNSVVGAVIHTVTGELVEIPMGPPMTPSVLVTEKDAVYILNPSKPDLAVIYKVTGEQVEVPIVPSAIPNILDLEPIEGVVSEISGKPAVIYASDDIELRLSVGELLRFMNLSLEAEEFKYILDKYGMFYEIHDDFYDPRDGTLFQPIFAPEEIDQAILTKVERMRGRNPGVAGPNIC